jgi:hypothetical protein
MSVTASNLVGGPATLYLGLYGATEPADTAVNTTPATSAWNDLGGTDGGLELNMGMDFFELGADQVTWIMERRNSKMDPRIKTSLAELTLENFKYAMNSLGTITSGSGFKSYDVDITNSATQPTYVALLVDGWAPSSAGVAKRRRVVARKCLQMGNIEFAYKKDGQSFYTVEFGVHYIDGTTKPIRWIDAT